MALISLLFFVSGLSGLIYQVVWVREFGNVFGNTVYSASLIIAVFMLGLGVGSSVVGKWADQQYAARPESLLRTYGLFELLIGAAGLAISAFLPYLGSVSALASVDAAEASLPVAELIDMAMRGASVEDFKFPVVQSVVRV